MILREPNIFEVLRSLDRILDPVYSKLMDINKLAQELALFPDKATPEKLDQLYKDIKGIYKNFPLTKMDLLLCSLYFATYSNHDTV